VVLDIDTGVLHLPDDELPSFPCTALLSAKLETLAKVIFIFKSSVGSIDH
jgi:hypothetical protein